MTEMRMTIHGDEWHVRADPVIDVPYVLMIAGFNRAHYQLPTHACRALAAALIAQADEAERMVKRGR